MPEGHTIHRLARDLAKDLKNETVSAQARQERFAQGAARIDGTTVLDTEAWGKHLFVEFDTADLLHVHLGLVGTFRRRSPDDEPSDALRLRIATDEVAWDLTGPMTCDLADPDHRANVIGPLGPDPLRRDADPDDFVDGVSSSRRAIAVQLLDQSVVAGIGNVYRAEALFLAGVHPRTPGDRIDPAELRALWDLLVELLRDGVKRNRIVTVTSEDRPAGPIKRTDALYAYKRAGKPCRRCGTDIARTEVANRKVWWCPSCQPG